MYSTLATKTPRKKSASKNPEPTNLRGKKVAIWLDRTKAQVFTFHDEEIDCSVINSAIEGRHRSTGGTGAPRPYAEYSLSSEKNEHRRRQENQKKYFARITEAVQGADTVLLMGPGKTKNKLEKQLLENKTFANKLEPEPIPTDHLTEGELKALVRGYFTD